MPESDEWQERLTEMLAKRARRRDATKALRAQLAAARAMGKAASQQRKLRDNERKPG